jgi:magnesium transporter
MTLYRGSRNEKEAEQVLGECAQARDSGEGYGKGVMKSFASKAQLPPGTLVYTGDVPVGVTPGIKVFVYDEEHMLEQDVATIADALALRRKGAVAWINVNGLWDTRIIEDVGRELDVHALVLEDILHVSQRPKCEDYGDYLFFVAPMLALEAGESGVPTLSSEQVSFILAPDLLITFQEREGDVFETVRNRIRHGKGHVRRMKPDYLLYVLLDAIVDTYFMILERIGEESENLEEALVESAPENTVHGIHRMKRMMVALRRSIWPLREAISCLDRGEAKMVSKRSRVYFRDLYDHTIQVMDIVESLRDIVSGMLDIYLSAMSNRMNNVMKVLTIIATIFIPLTFIAGVYGMNFEYMPELHYRWAYPATLGLMLAVSLVMLAFFRRKRWI